MDREIYARNLLPQDCRVYIYTYIQSQLWFCYYLYSWNNSVDHFQKGGLRPNGVSNWRSKPAIRGYICIYIDMYITCVYKIDIYIHLYKSIVKCRAAKTFPFQYSVGSTAYDVQENISNFLCRFFLLYALLKCNEDR